MGPLYQRIADDLRAQITDRTFLPGDRLPTELGLAQLHGVARATVRQAFAVLVNEGLIVAARPRGHFVRQVERLTCRPQAEWQPRPAVPEMDLFLTSHEHDPGLRTPEKIKVELVEPPPDIAKRLALAETKLAVVRRRVLYLDRLPVRSDDSYYLLLLVEGSDIMRPDDVARGCNQVLTELGAEPVRAIDEIEIRMPSPQEAHRLDLGAGVPVAVHRVTSYTRDGQPVRCTVNILPGDRHVILFERAKAGAG